MGKRIDVSELPPVVGTLYPSPFDTTSRARERTKLGDAAGLTQFGVNLLKLPPVFSRPFRAQIRIVSGE